MTLTKVSHRARFPLLTLATIAVTRTTAISFLLAIPLLASLAQGQKADWRAVQHLPAGTRLTIKLKHGRHLRPTAISWSDGRRLTCDYGGFCNTSNRITRATTLRPCTWFTTREPSVELEPALGRHRPAATHGPLVNHEFFAALDAGILGGLAISLAWS